MKFVELKIMTCVPGNHLQLAQAQQNQQNQQKGFLRLPQVLFVSLAIASGLTSVFGSAQARAETILKPKGPLSPQPLPPTSQNQQQNKASSNPSLLAKPQPFIVALDWVPNTNHTGIYVANQRKWYAAQNLVPTFLQPAQTTATQLVGAGKAEFGVSFTNDVALARAQGLPIVAIAAIVQNNTSCFAWRKNLNIKSLKDFEGKRYGGWGSPEEEITLSYLMKKQGADFKKVRVITTGVSDFLATTPRNADFMWIYVGWDGIQAKLKGVELGTLCPKDLDPVLNTSSPLLVTSEKLIQEKPELVRRFLAATAAGYEFAAASPVQAAEDLVDQVPELDKKLVLESAKYLAAEYKKGVPKWGTQSEKKWAQYLEWAKKEGLVSKIEATERYFNNGFLPK